MLSGQKSAGTELISRFFADNPLHFVLGVFLIRFAEMDADGVGSSVTGSLDEGNLCFGLNVFHKVLLLKNKKSPSVRMTILE